DATLEALQSYFPTSGKAANLPLVGARRKVKLAAIALNQLRGALTGAILTDVKNVRNLNEFRTLGEAATGGLDAANDVGSLKKVLQTLKDRIATARTIARQQAGLPAEAAPAEEAPKVKKYYPKTGNIE